MGRDRQTKGLRERQTYRQTDEEGDRKRTISKLYFLSSSHTLGQWFVTGPSDAVLQPQWTACSVEFSCMDCLLSCQRVHLTVICPPRSAPSTLWTLCSTVFSYSYENCLLSGQRVYLTVTCLPYPVLQPVSFVQCGVLICKLCTSRSENSPDSYLSTLSCPSPSMNNVQCWVLVCKLSTFRSKNSSDS